MSLTDAASAMLLAAGGVFFLAGTVGLLRFPEAFSRLHAVTKADNLGLGLVVAALAVRAASPALAVKLVAIWLLALLASASAATVIAQRALHDHPEAPDRERS